MPAAPDDCKTDTGREMPLLEHLRELRRRLLYSLWGLALCSIAAYIFYPQIIDLLYRPFRQLAENCQQSRVLFAMSLFEGFLVKIKISIIAGAVLSSPLHLWNIVRFILPALTDKEKKLLNFCLSAGFVLALLSVYYGYFYIIPPAVNFMTTSDFIPQQVSLMLNFRENIFYIIQFLLLCVLTFQLPLVLELLLALNLLNRRKLLAAGRYIIVGIFIFAAVVTPPDCISQLAVAIPLIVLFYLTILIAVIFKWGEK